MCGFLRAYNFKNNINCNGMKYKTLVRVLFIVSCLVFTLQKNSYANEKLEITHGPYLVEPGENCMTIIWFTNKPSLSWVEYCGDNNFGVFPQWGGYPKITKGSTNGLIDANTKRHSIRLTNLEAGTKYKYRIVSKEILQYDPYEVIYGDSTVDEIYEFETLSAQKSNFSFGAVTDMHERAAVLDTLLQNSPLDSMDMVFFTGDMLNWIGDEERIFNGLIDVSVDHFAKTKPFILTRGNHETRGPNARDLFPYFPHSSGKYYYAFSHGNVRFLVLDCGEDKPDTHPVYAGLVDFDQYRSEQAEWLIKEVERDEFKNAQYRIALFHIPPFTGRGYGGKDLTEKWGPILNEADIDLVISGHTHRFERIEPRVDMNNFPILILGRDMMLKTEVSSKQLSLSIKDTDGKVVDEFNISEK
jgi:predicted phosphodiesterase